MLDAYFEYCNGLSKFVLFSLRNWDFVGSCRKLLSLVSPFVHVVLFLNPYALHLYFYVNGEIRNSS